MKDGTLAYSNTPPIYDPEIQHNVISSNFYEAPQIHATDKAEPKLFGTNYFRRFRMKEGKMHKLK